MTPDELPPPRPAAESLASLGFRPAKRPCRWLAPSLLFPTAVRAALGILFGAFFDRRELMGALPAEPAEDFSRGRGQRGQPGSDELWFDYVADTGDGFAATYTVASLLAQPILALDGLGEPLPRGRILVMGGDQCYPTASVTGYRDRLVGPYRAALPFVSGDAGARPRLYALPGNHDWYDGLTAFLRVFCQGSSVGGWLTRQTRSYFAVRLPHGWWLLGVDAQFDTYLDAPQLRYFEQVASRMRDGDAVVLCSARPSWIAADDAAYAALDYLERTVIRPTGAEVLVSIAGDRHHYARYAERDGPRQKITAGGGGAYLAPTHRLPTTISLPAPSLAAHSLAAAGRSSSPGRFHLVERYPDKTRSRTLAAGIFRLAWLAPGLAAVFGAVDLLIAVSVGDTVEHPAGGFVDRLDTIELGVRGAGLADVAVALVTTVLGLAVCVATVACAVLATRAARAPKGWLVGLAHAAGQLALALVVLVGALAVTDPIAGRWMLAAAGALVFVVGGLGGTTLLAAYLWFAYDAARLAGEDVYAAQGITGYKNFLRMRVAPDGSLTVYPIGVRQVCERWRLDPDGPPDGPWFVPADWRRRPRPVLIEKPVRVERPSPRRRASDAERPGVPELTR